MQDLISKLSEIRSKYNCFDDDEAPFYRALSEAIRILSKRADGDTISRAAALDAIKKSRFLVDAMGKVIKLPSAQQEIITCIDCIHYTPLGKDKSWGRCPVHSSPTENQRMCQSCDFCAWAERRNDG